MKQKGIEMTYLQISRDADYCSSMVVVYDSRFRPAPASCSFVSFDTA